MVLLFSTPVAAQIQVSGVLDAGKNAGASVLVGERGFSVILPLDLNEDFPSFGVSGCNADPARCIPGATLPVTVFVPDITVTATLDGATYRSGCGSCTTSFFYQTSGSVTLPPLAPTATATGRFTITGFLGPQDQPRVNFTGAGTVTLYLHSPGSAGWPNSWWVDRAVLRLDSPLPEPWMSVDVGIVGTPGSTTGTVASDGLGQFTVDGSGSDIWGTSDAFQFAFAHPAGGDIVARVDSETAANPFAKAGVMMRSSFSADASNVLLDVKPDGGVEFMARAVAGMPTTFIAGGNAEFPVWLKLSRTDQQVTASISRDGQAWEIVGSIGSVPAGFTGLAVTSHDPSMLNRAMFSQVSVGDNPNEPLPTGWLQADVGAVSLSGSAIVDGSEVAVSADGADIWGTADAFHYVYQQFTNDGAIVARVSTLQNTSPYAKAGVMIRQSATAGSAHALVDVKPDGGIEFLVRTANGAETSFVAGGFQAMPTWLRLARSGQTFTAAVSMDGTSWVAIGSADLPGFNVFATAGLAVTSHNTGSLTTATFDSIAVTQSQAVPVPWGTSNVGATGLQGSALWNAGAFTVKGAGADIWGTTDGFMFVLQHRNTDPATLSARVVSETDTNPYAKAGLMLRNGFNVANAAFVMIDLKPNGEIEVLQRSADGGEVTYLGGAAVGLGTYLRLQRTGSTVELSYSADGAAWTTVATTTVSIPATADIGLAVTSHDTTQLNTAVFDQVTGPR